MHILILNYNIKINIENTQFYKPSKMQFCNIMLCKINHVWAHQSKVNLNLNKHKFKNIIVKIYLN